jgi:hypothetical protein
MASDYRAITEYNERQLGCDTASRKTQISMYSDPTHFIFEILQNADDYGATEVYFRLSRSELVIEHNGKPFFEDNVKAITYFGRSTSRDDLVKTGRFGVGFKSVFAFTATPIIISGEERFKIHGLYRLDDHPYPDDLLRILTRITLPFNHEAERPDYVDEHMPASEAYKMISARLSGLNMNTLLFTRTIREIRWEIEDKSGHYLREDKTVKGARQTSITNGDDLISYLVFSRTPSWKGQDHKDVEVAFRTDGKGQLVPIDEYLYVLFPTAQETHLKFIINGPYRTNPSRETISEDDAFNRHLIKETCELMKMALPSLRDRKLLTMNSLAAMPIAADSLREFYSPILDVVIKSFRHNDLVPTHKDTFASASRVLQGPAAIREVITDKELAFLVDVEDPTWAKGVTPGSRTDQFLRSLNIIQWGWRELESVLDSKFESFRWSRTAEADQAWLDSRDDQWLQKLYILLAEGVRKEECDQTTVSACRIIRVTEDKETTHTSGASSYFPKSRGYHDLPQVKKSILSGKNEQHSKTIEDALITLGVRPIGTEERLDQVLDNHYRGYNVVVEPEQHLEHMKMFLKAWKKEGSVTKFWTKRIFMGISETDFHRPDDCYLEAPLKSTGLGAIHDEPRKGLPQKYKLSLRYQGLIKDGFLEFAVACGTQDRISIETQACSNHPRASFLMKDFGDGVRLTATKVDDDYTISSLKALLAKRDLAVNLLIWDALRIANPDVLTASFRPNRNFDTQEDKSTLVIILSKTEWIPNKKGVLLRPESVSKTSLHSSFRYDNRNGWLDAIGFGEADRQASEAFQKRKELAKQAGVDVSAIEILSGLSKEKQLEYSEWIQKKERADARERKKQEDAMPFHEAIRSAFLQNGGPQHEHDEETGRTSKNPGRRKAKLAEEISADLENASSPENRVTFGLCKKWKAKNDDVKTKLLGWYGGACQICKRTFTQRNNQPYFEGLYLVPHTKAGWIDRVGNVLCLCPWHSAMFQFGSKELESDILERVLNFVPQADGGTQKAEITLKLCSERLSINFHEDHFLELQTMIEESRKKSK